MTKEEIMGKMYEVISTLDEGVDRSEPITPETPFNDFMDSLAQFEMQYWVELEFKMKVPDEEAEELKSLDEWVNYLYDKLSADKKFTLGPTLPRRGLLAKCEDFLRQQQQILGAQEDVDESMLKCKVV